MSYTPPAQPVFSPSTLEIPKAGTSNAGFGVGLQYAQDKDTVIDMTYTGELSGYSSVTIPAGTTAPVDLGVCCGAWAVGEWEYSPGHLLASAEGGSGADGQALWAD